MEIAFRDAREGDAEALAALFRASFIDTFGHLYRAEDLASFLAKHKPDAWRAQIASPEFALRLAEEGGDAVAFAKLGPNELPVDTDSRALELHQFYVAKPWQGKGVARPLMEWVLAQARRRNAEELYLSVWTQNHRARRFYQGYGFAFVAPYAFMVGEQADEDEIFRLALDAAA